MPRPTDTRASRSDDSVVVASMTSEVVPNGATVLIMSGSDDARRHAREALSGAGLDVMEADTATTGLELAEGLPDLIFIDVELPDMSGHHATAALKLNPLTQHIPIIQRASVVIGHDDQVDGLIAGADAYLVEPIDRDVLLATVAAQLRQRELSRQLEVALSLDVSGVYDWAIPTGQVRWTPSLERIHRMEPGSFAGTFEDFVATVHPDDRDHVARVLEEVIESGDSIDFSFRFQRADGSRGWMESRGRLFRDHASRPVRLLGLAHDITNRVVERQRIEQLRRLASGLTAARTVQRVLEVAATELTDTSLHIRLVVADEPTDDTVVFSYPAGRQRLELVETPDFEAPVSRPQAIAIGELTGTALDRAMRFEAERSNAVALQRALLPTAIPDIPGWWLDARYEPALEEDRLGGDFFDVVELGDSFVVVIGDVAGHGLDATTQMGTVRTLLRALAVSHDGDPATVLQRARVLFPGVCGEATPFVSASIARCEPDGRVAVASAGHPGPIVRHDDRATLLKLRPGPPLGTFRSAADHTVEFELGPDDWMVCFTDGVFERRDLTLDDAISSAEGRLIGALTAVEIIASGEHAEGEQHRDDRAVVMVRRLGDRRS